jgi:hypothetical protein
MKSSLGPKRYNDEDGEGNPSALKVDDNACLPGPSR